MIHGGGETCDLPIREFFVDLPSCHNGRNEASQECRAVEEHVEGVRDEPQAIGPHAIEQLHKRKGQVQEKKEEEVACSLL